MCLHSCIAWCQAGTFTLCSVLGAGTGRGLEGWWRGSLYWWGPEGQTTEGGRGDSGWPRGSSCSVCGQVCWNSPGIVSSFSLVYCYFTFWNIIWLCLKPSWLWFSLTRNRCETLSCCSKMSACNKCFESDGSPSFKAIITELCQIHEDHHFHMPAAELGFSDQWKVTLN